MNNISYYSYHLVLFRKPTIQRKQIKVICSEPHKISKVEVENMGVNNIQVKNPIVNPKTGRILTYSYRDFSLVTTVKDKEGRTFDNTSSLFFRISMSDENKALIGSPLKHPYTFLPDVPTTFKVPLRGKTNIFIEGLRVDFSCLTFAFTATITIIGHKQVSNSQARSNMLH